MGQDLYNLVQTLSATEKRYFRQQQIHAEGKAYMRVFEWLEKMKEWEEGDAEKEFEGEKFMKQFGVVKNYLKMSLLDSLRRFHRSNFPLFQLRNRLDHVELLYHRGLVKSSLKEAKSLQRIARDADFRGILIEAMKWEIKLLRLEKKGPERIRELRQDILAATAIEIREAEISALFDEIFHQLLHRARLDGGSQEEWLADLLAQANAFEASELGIHARIILGQVRAYVHLLQRDYPALNQRYAQIVQLLETHKSYRSHRPDLALNLFTAYLETCFLLNNFSETDRMIHLINSLPTRTRSEKARQAAIATQLSIQNDIEQQNYHAAARREPEVSQLFRRQGAEIPATYSITLRHHLCLSLFLSGNYEACQKWLRHILNDPPSPNRMDIWEFARLLYPLCLFETDNLYLLGYEIRNSERFFIRRERLGDFEKGVFSFLKQVLKQVTSEEQSASLAALQLQLGEMEEKAGSHLGYNIVRKWVEEKIKGEEN